MVGKWKWSLLAYIRLDSLRKTSEALPERAVTGPGLPPCSKCAVFGLGVLGLEAAFPSWLSVLMRLFCTFHHTLQTCQSSGSGGTDSENAAAYTHTHTHWRGKYRPWKPLCAKYTVTG